MFQDLIKHYNEFHHNEIQTNRFQPEKFNDIIDRLVSEDKISLLGVSVEGRPIRMITLGSGPVKVLMWSQMHGNESTATRAILDLLKLHQAPGQLQQAWEAILSAMTIYLIPIVNPDGTAAFKRRNALEIDLNRDARAFVSPEARILQDAMQSINPDFSFNLHDQRRFYNITGTSKPSTISFLAPAFNRDETVNKIRLKAMQMIGAMRDTLETVIPGQVGLYDDSFAPRAFGDYSQASGSSTILIEAGWQAYDMEKEFVRKLVFALIVSSLDHIAQENYQQYTEASYRAIPMNDEKLFDVLIRQAQLVFQGKQVTIDLGIMREEVSINGTERYFSKGSITDVGDLYEWFGFEEVDASDLLLVNGKTLDMGLSTWQKLDRIKQLELLKQGNLFLIEPTASQSGDNSGEIINTLQKETAKRPIEFEQVANFLLINKAGKIKYIILNGFLWPANEDAPEGLNGLILP